MKAFISYSHKDQWALERLHTHLAMLRREGKIVEWFDREILAGGVVDAEISEQLESCVLFLALVSPDFLASDYCYEREMTRALERHEARETRVIPIIIEPCDWKASPLKKLKVTPRDGKPVSEWTNQNNAFVDIVGELRRVLTEEKVEGVATSATADTDSPRLARRYRIRRDFDEIDRGDFRIEAFKTIRTYFQAAVAEIDGIEGIRGRFVPHGSQSFGCTVVNKAMQSGTAHITVHTRNSNVGLGDIYYSFSENAPPNRANGTFNVDSDEYDLFLKSSPFGLGEAQERLSPEQAAEQIWTRFLEQAGISNG